MQLELLLPGERSDRNGPCTVDRASATVGHNRTFDPAPQFTHSHHPHVSQSAHRPTSHTESTSLDSLLHVEETLVQAFSQNSFAEVDGHDIGDGRFNIYIYPTDTWGPVIERVYAFLKLRGVLKTALVVKRLKTSEEYVVVWPEQFKGTFEL